MTEEERKARTEYQRSYYLANREKVLARTAARKRDKAALVKEESRRWYEANRESKLAQNAAWSAANRGYHMSLNRAWDTENPGARKVIKRKYRQANKGKGNADKALRNAAKIQATPPWLTAAQKAEIKALYTLAGEKGLHVDHIVPLRGKTVCGLHVPWNLQLLTAFENMSKHNKLTGQGGSHVIAHLPIAPQTLDERIVATAVAKDRHIYEALDAQ